VQGDQSERLTNLRNDSFADEVEVRHLAREGSTPRPIKAKRPRAWTIAAKYENRRRPVKQKNQRPPTAGTRKVRQVDCLGEEARGPFESQPARVRRDSLKFKEASVVRHRHQTSKLAALTRGSQVTRGFPSLRTQEVTGPTCRKRRQDRGT
jgi:hypothetical protein